MNQYFVVKTGWEMFDLSRAYGVGILLYGLSKSDVLISDKAYYYAISAPKISSINTAVLTQFLADDLSWGETLLTAPGKGRINSPKVKDAKDFLTGRNSSKRVSDILKRYSTFRPTQIPSSKGETLYQPMELRGTKGLRDPVRLRKQYSEGSSIKVNKDDWMLSLLGHLNVTVWKYDRPFDGLLVAMPVPSFQGTKIAHLGDIKNRIKNAIFRIHQAGKMPTLAWVGVKITEATLDLVKTPLQYAPRFSSILYSSMRATGKGAMKRWKPATAGIFPLEHLNEIAKSPSAKSILSLFEEIFRSTNKAGYEDLAESLSRFLAEPTLVNFENYSRLHLRCSLTKEVRLPLYSSKNITNEVMKNVRD